MTETTYTSPRLERPRDTALKGVCTALARTTGTDPLLWRVLALGLCFFGGLGAILYLIGIVAIPAEGEARSLAERMLKGPDRRVTTGQSLLLALVLLMIAGFFFDDRGDGLLVGAVAGALAMLWWRDRTERTSAPTSMPASIPSPPALVTPAAPYSPPLPWTPPPAKPRSPLGGLTVSLAVLVAGVLLLIGTSDTANIPVEVVLAAALGTVGLGLVAGAFFGRSPGLLALAVLLALSLGATAGARPALEAGIGDRTWTPDGSGSFRLGVGEATLDLRSLPASAPTDITARVEVGHLLVLVPDGLRVSLDARAGVGDVQLFGADFDGRRVDRHLEIGPTGAPVLTLDLSVRAGMVEVRRG